MCSGKGDGVMLSICVRIRVGLHTCDHIHIFGDCLDAGSNRSDLSYTVQLCCPIFSPVLEPLRGC